MSDNDKGIVRDGVWVLSWSGREMRLVWSNNEMRERALAMLMMTNADSISFTLPRTVNVKAFIAKLESEGFVCINNEDDDEDEDEGEEEEEEEDEDEEDEGKEEEEDEDEEEEEDEDEEEEYDEDEDEEEDGDYWAELREDM